MVSDPVDISAMAQPLNSASLAFQHRDQLRRIMITAIVVPWIPGRSNSKTAKMSKDLGAGMRILSFLLQIRPFNSLLVYGFHLNAHPWWHPTVHH